MHNSQCLEVFQGRKGWKSPFSSIQVTDSPADYKLTWRLGRYRLRHAFTEVIQMECSTNKSDNLVKRAMPEGIGPSKLLP